MDAELILLFKICAVRSHFCVSIRTAILSVDRLKPTVGPGPSPDHSVDGWFQSGKNPGRGHLPAARSVKWRQLFIAEQYGQLAIAVMNDVRDRAHNRRRVTFAPVRREREYVAETEHAGRLTGTHGRRPEDFCVAEQDFAVSLHDARGPPAANRPGPQAVGPGEQERPLAAQK